MEQSPSFEVDFDHWQDRALAVVQRTEEFDLPLQVRYRSIVNRLVDQWFPDSNPVGELVDDGEVDLAEFIVLVTIQEMALNEILDAEENSHD